MEQPGEEAPRCLVAFHGFGAVLMAGAPVVRGDGSFDLIDVVAASGPRGLAADAASSCLAHQAVSLQSVLNVGGTCMGSEVRRISDCRILSDLVSCVTLGAIRSNFLGASTYSSWPIAGWLEDGCWCPYIHVISTMSGSRHGRRAQKQ